MDAKTELLQLKQLLQLERKEELERNAILYSTKTIDQRKKAGVTWFPLHIKETGYGIGDNPFFVAEYPPATRQRHPFQAGRPIKVFSDNEQHRGEQTNGIIHYEDRGTIKIILYTDDLPYWLLDGRIGIDLMPDERTYNEMEAALDRTIKAEKGRLYHLREILLGHQQPQFRTLPSPDLPTLNASQQHAVSHILAADDVAIVHGPPGTGKTTTLVQAIRLLCKTEKTILVCAPSNTAADVLTERIAANGMNVIRIGNISRIDEAILSHTLEMTIQAHPDTKELKKVRKEVDELRREAHKFKRTFDQDAREERKHVLRQAKDLANWAVTLEERIIDQILDNAQVITCTLVGTQDRYLRDRTFKTVVIDEAAQALEPATWIAIGHAQKVVLAGDPLQLPPTLHAIEAQKKGLGVTLMEKTMKRHVHSSMLTVQYRMNECIMGFSNEQFYEGKLLAHESVRNHTLQVIEGGNDIPLEFVDTAGCGFDEKTNPESLSHFNPDEYNLLREHLLRLVAYCNPNYYPSIGILSPYKEQVLYIDAELKQEAALKPFLPYIQVNTIDGFQGQERDVIYISLVRSNDTGIIGFLNDHRRMNVAMTRARKKLVVIGNSETLAKHRFYQDFMDYAEMNEAYVSAWEYIQ